MKLIHPHVCIAAIVLCLSSCDRAPENMATVEGSVTWNGQDLESGFITFVPGDSKLPQSGRIENGRFTFHAYTGKNTIRIESTKVTGYVPSMKQNSFKQFIPPKYNERSVLSEVVEPEGDNHFEFSLSGEDS